MTRNLVPTDGDLFVVRWVRADGSETRHRYYRRRIDAETFLARLLADGRDVAMYRTSTWEAS